MGITVELWRARIGLFSGGRGSRPHSKASSTKHQPLYFSDTVGSTAKVVQGGLLLLYILKFLSSQDKTKFLQRTRNVGLLVILIAVLLHSLTHLLLLAGDVESNPGPRMDGTLTLDDLKEAHSKLSKSWNRWFEVGQALNVDNVTLDSIRKQCADDNSTCFREMLAHRLKSGPPLTWEVLNSLRTQSSMQVSGVAGQKRPLSSQGSSALPVNLQWLMDTYQLTTSQVDCNIQQKDIPYLAAYFDNAELYVDAMELTTGEQNDVRKCASTHEAIIVCLKIWKEKKFSKVTFRFLLDMLVKLKKQKTASQVCHYLKNLSVDIATPALKSGAQKNSLNSLPTQSSLQETSDTYQESSVSSGDESATDSFICPYCKVCSVQQFFSKEGCPKKTRSLEITNLFPYLDVSGLSGEDVIDLEDILVTDTSDIMKKFSNFSLDIRKSLDRQDILDNLRDCVLSSIVLLKDQNVSGLDTEHKVKILEAENLANIFSVLRVYNYISFLNYQIIEQLIQDHGTDDDHRRLHQYIAHLKIFWQRNVFEVPWSVFPSRKSRKTAKVFVLKCTEAALSLGRARMLQDNVAEICNLKSHALQLCSVKKGCVELHFLVSAAVAEHIFPLSPSQQSALSGIGAMILPLEEKENMQVTDVDLPILHEVLAQSSHKQVQQQIPTIDDGGPQLLTTLEDGELRRPVKPEELYLHLVSDVQERACAGTIAVSTGLDKNNQETEPVAHSLVIMSDTAPAENNPSSKEAPKYRHDWYQTASDVCVNVMIKGLKKEQVQVEFTERTLCVAIELVGESPYALDLHLAHSIDCGKCGFKILKTKVEIKLRKVKLQQWCSLEETDATTKTKMMPSMPSKDKVLRVAKDEVHKYPTSSHHSRDCDKLVAEVKKEEKEDEIKKAELMEEDGLTHTERNWIEYTEGNIERVKMFKARHESELKSHETRRAALQQRDITDQGELEEVEGKIKECVSEIQTCEGSIYEWENKIAETRRGPEEKQRKEGYSTERFFLAHLKDFEDYLNIDEVIPLLSKQLLTLDEMETLDSLSTRKKKIKHLVKIMCIKGDRAPFLFIECVRNAKEHFPHPELADKMEKWLQDRPAHTPPIRSAFAQNQALATNNSQPSNYNVPQVVRTNPVPAVSSDEQDSTNAQDISTVDTISNHTASTDIMVEQTLQVPIEEQISASSLPQVIDAVPHGLGVNTAETVSSRQQDNTNPNSLQGSTVSTFESQFEQGLLPLTMAEQTPCLVRQTQVTIDEQISASSLPHVINVPYGLRANNAVTVSTSHQNPTDTIESSLSNFEPRFEQNILLGTMAEETPRLVQQAQVPIQEQTTNSLLYQNSPSSFADDLPSPLNQVAPDYAHLVQRISSYMATNDVSIDSVIVELNRILHDGHMGITIQQEEVRDFGSLCVYIRQLGLCHESDIDLLCRLLHVLGLQELHSLALEYADHIMSNQALTCQYNSTSTQTHHLLLTLHSNPDMTLGEAFVVKDMIAGVLSIQRHTFSLASTRHGSIVLVWKIPAAFLKQSLSVFGVDEIRTRLDSDPTLSSIKLEYMERSQVRIEEVYSKRRMICDRNISSSTEQMDEEEGPSSTFGVKRGAQSDVTVPTDLQPPPLRRPRPDRSHGKLIGFRTEESDRLPEQPSTSQSNLQFRQPPHEFGRQYIPPSRDDQSHYSSPLVRSSSTRSERHSIDESPLQVLIKTLRTSYADEKFFNKSAGINKGTIKYIYLALVKKKGISAADAENDEFLQSTLHGSVDDIIKKKKEDIKLQGIFTYGKEGSRKLVLVEGAPGVGKTMLALHMCQLWANKDLLDEYDMVLLVTLRRFQRKPLVELSDLLIYLQGSLLDEATEELLRSQGERTLFILEGWDELPPTLREEGSFFFDIVEGNILPKASVLVTSRPTVTSDLYEYMDERHIEVLGFSTKEITQYVQLHGGDMSETVLSHLNKFPNLKALAHIPLTLSIICHVARKDSALPHTLTELYRQHICNTLFLTLKRHVTFKSLSGVSCLEELPVEVRSVINSLCTLALDGFKEKKFVYSKEDLQRVGLKPNAFDGYGLLNAPVMAVAAGFEQIYQFNHLSIQEFLAAYGIQHLVNDQRVSLLREFRNDKQFQNIWKFFSGITRLENEYFKELIISGTGKANRDQIFLLHCLYEADNPAISKKAAEKMFYVLNLGNMLLNTTDCLCAAHMITSVGGDWQVELRGCNMGDDGLRIFKTSLLTHIEAHGVLGFTIKRLDLTQNRIRAVSVCHLADMINSKMQLHSLILSSNPFGDEGMRTLTRALKQSHATTKSLHFSSCELTKDGAFELADVLRANSTIEELYIGFEQFGCHGVTRIAQALDNRYNKTLTELSLTKTDMTSVGLTALAQMAPVNQTLKFLRLDRNDLGADDCHLVATIIEKSSSLILIDLSKNPIGDVGFVRVLEALIVKRKGSLKKLGVFGCDVTPKGLKKLMELFSVTETFVGIQLGCNHLGDEGAELVGEALKRNSSNSVKQVLMEATKVTDKGKKKLQEICDSINSGRDTENKLDLNYKHHSQVVQKRNSTNYL